MTVLEGESGWMNFVIAITNVIPTLYIGGPIKAVVDSSKLSMYAASTTEKSFLAKNNYSTLYPSQVKANDIGYNSGNRLIG